MRTSIRASDTARPEAPQARELEGEAVRIRSPWQDVGRRLMRHRGAALGVVLLAAIVVGSAGAPLFAPDDPTTLDLGRMLEGPSLQSPAGRDALGRDLLSRTLYGGRTSLLVAVAGTVVGGGLGTILGLVSGYFEGWLDAVVMRTMDVLLAFPGLLLAIVIIAILGPGLVNVIAAIAVFSIPAFARVARASTLAAKSHEYVAAARAAGASDLRVMLAHIAPNIVAPIVVLVSLRMATAILTAASLSFLGLGVRPPTPEWGAMLSESRDYFWMAPHIMVAPGLALLLTVLAFNLLGDGLRDVMDPRMRGEL